jgi:hypothetical protein
MGRVARHASVAACSYNSNPPTGGFDAGRTERFIDYHRDGGPEKTME